MDIDDLSDEFDYFNHDASNMALQIIDSDNEEDNSNKNNTTMFPKQSPLLEQFNIKPSNINSKNDKQGIGIIKKNTSSNKGIFKPLLGDDNVPILSQFSSSIRKISKNKSNSNTTTERFANYLSKKSANLGNSSTNVVDENIFENNEVSQTANTIPIIYDIHSAIRNDKCLRENDAVKVSINILKMAIDKGELVIVDRILTGLRDVDVSLDEGDENFCMQCCRLGYHDILALLLLNYCDPNYLGKDDTTALMVASYHGYYNCCSVLVSAGAHVNLINTKGESALTRAVSKGNINIVNYLLSVGVNVHAMEAEENSALHMARKLKLVEIESLCQQHESRINCLLKEQCQLCLGRTSTIIGPLMKFHVVHLEEGEEFLISFKLDPSPVMESEFSMLVLANGYLLEGQLIPRFCGGCPVQSVDLNGTRQTSFVPGCNFFMSFAPLKCKLNELMITVDSQCDLRHYLIVSAFRIKLNK